ncbi:hypothetical protein Aduo_007580 [Ancylostoma duodenale]
MLLTTVIFALAAPKVLGVGLKVKILPSASCQEHVIGDKNLIVDTVSIFHTDKKKKILSAASVSISKSFDQSHGIQVDTGYVNHQGRLNGDVLKDDPNGEYHLILNVRARNIDKETPITYFYTEQTMQWSQSEESEAEWNPKLYYQSPFLPGAIEVQVNNRVVINRPDDASLCYNAYAWIPQHGIYLLNKRNEWTQMFYYPHYFPQYLS